VLLASWLSKLFSSQEFGSALFGAVVGGLFVLLAQMLANRAQRKRDRQTEREALIGTLRAIQAELLVLRADCLQPLSRRLKATVPGPFLTMPVQENFFIVYESNAGALGRIGDPKLVAEIVRVYGQAKGLNDALNFNHTRCQVWANLDAAHKGAETQPSDTLAALEKELGHIRAGIDRGLRTLLEDSDRLCADIEAYLDGRKKTR
jgi:hypothetical protein